MPIQTKFKPNLIDNVPKDGSFTNKDMEDIITSHGGIENYIAFPKKDGCRLELGLGPRVLSRSLKEPGSELVKTRFTKLNQICLDLNMIIEGEFYMHGEAFNHINRFFAKSDVTTPEYLKELTNMKEKKPEAFYEKFRGKDIPFLTTFHEELKFWAFDFIITDRPDLLGFEERWDEACRRLLIEALNSFSGKTPEESLIKFFGFHSVVMPTQLEISSFISLDSMYKDVLSYGYEGLVLVHKQHEYKYGRSRLKAGTIFKMKEDKEEYDGVVLDVAEATEVKEGIEKTVNELGRSVTSKKKDDRVPSGLAKGFVVEFEGKGTFPVGLSGFDNEAKKELLDNKESYIGRHFRYTGMKPVKDFPRHAYFDTWRDEK
tara:strand:+ start:3116 stop:4234 length:1119 start_codon:yes stop_codon:yes gene_type:complete